MNPKSYQSAATRTECDQTRSVARVANLSMSSTKDYGESQLKAVRINHAVIGLAGEVGELASAVEKWIYYSQEPDWVNLKEEVGDCMWYIALLCNAAKFDLGDVMEGNIRKLRVRYPEKYRDDLAREDNRDRVKEAELVRGSSEVRRSTGIDFPAEPNIPADPLVESLRPFWFSGEKCHTCGEPARVMVVDRTYDPVREKTYYYCGTHDRKATTVPGGDG